MTVMRIIRAVYTGLAVAVLVALLSGRDDPPTNLCISVSSLVIIALVAWWSWLRDRRDRPPPVPNRIPGGLFKEKSPMHDGSPDHQPHSPTGGRMAIRRKTELGLINLRNWSLSVV